MKSRTFRRTFAFFAEKQISEVFKVAVLLLALAVPAAAQKPTIQLVPFTSAFVPAADACGFDVLATPQAGRPNKAREIQFANMVILAGPLFVTLKNLSTGKTIDVNVSGPEHFNVSSNTLVVAGPSIGLEPPPGNLLRAAGLPPLPLAHGQLVFTLDDQGNITSIDKVTGTVEDVCELLQ
jgi:hypothetical protein